MSDLMKSVLMRFVRGALASAVSSMVLIIPVGLNTFHDIQPWLVSLGLAGAIGFLSGGLQALDKYFRATDQANKTLDM